MGRVQSFFAAEEAAAYSTYQASDSAWRQFSVVGGGLALYREGLNRNDMTKNDIRLWIGSCRFDKVAETFRPDVLEDHISYSSSKQPHAPPRLEPYLKMALVTKHRSINKRVRQIQRH